MKKQIFSNFPLGKKFILITLLMILPIAIALESTKVYIIDLSYTDGKLIINDKIIKYGYAPDRTLQPLEGYRAEIISFDDDILYTFKFKIPLSEYTDISSNITNELSGGLIKLSENDFALILPYYENAEEIVFYDEENNKATSVDVKEEKKKEVKKHNYWLWLVEFIILLVLIIWFVIHKKKEKKEE